MPFIKGQSGNVRGRKYGVPNKTTKEMKEILRTVVEENLAYLNSVQDQLSIQDRIALIKTMLPYTNPKLSSIVVKDADSNNAFRTIDINIIRPNDNQ
ncbi:MAG: hypothetical protein FJX80_06545 [Bacteroidetes bacterium]|nr:hypothetical protein [Bacteroidota bacterium]